MRYSQTIIGSSDVKHSHASQLEVVHIAPRAASHGCGHRRGRAVGGDLCEPLLQDLEQDLGARDGCAQLVGDVGQQRALPRHQPLESFGHVVHGAAELVDLVGDA